LMINSTPEYMVFPKLRVLVLCVVECMEHGFQILNLAIIKKGLEDFVLHLAFVLLSHSIQADEFG